MSFLWIFLILVALVTVGGYLYNRRGPGDYVGDPNRPHRRNNWVP
jgi:hypothetical protein